MAEICINKSNDPMMIPVDNNNNNNNKADIVNISNAFRAASDDDTRNVMNVMMANQTTNSLELLKFYVVPKSWFLKSWPILMMAKQPSSSSSAAAEEYDDDNWKENIGRIQNAELVMVEDRDTHTDNKNYNNNNNTATRNTESESSSSSDRRPIEMNGGTTDDDNNKDKKTKVEHQIKMNGEITASDIINNNGSNFSNRKTEFLRRKMAENNNKKMSQTTTTTTKTKMKAGLIHTRDYFFLGPSAWMLVKEKFGYDGYEICRCCQKVAREEGGRGIEIALLPEEKNDNSDNNNNNAMSTTSSGSITSLEDDTTRLTSMIIPPSGRFPYEKVFSATTYNKDNHNKAIEIKLIDQKEDNDNELSWSDGGNQKEEKDEKEPPILLLSPSTTCNEYIDPLYTPIDDNTSMDIESNGIDASSTNSPIQLSGRKRLASGLGNMGNTCFMNSTLQCLAHTEPIRKYFLSGEYKNDLNRDNPLGTGGELATQFAILMGEMWGVQSSKRRNVLGGNQSLSYTNQYSSAAVYPRSFKNSLGKHAEQFCGYDQHDSQELATYLLDALHEDTNKITIKPYIEKPEQRIEESDASAADKAWELHLKREDSRVLENFMGQVKSRLECCEEGCNRVSTTFDPFMYLSVPIPGESERTLEVYFVSLDPNSKMRKLKLTLAKTSSITGVLEKINEEIVKAGICTESIPLHDLCPVEISNYKIYKWYKNEDTIDMIKDYDDTYVYQLRPLEEVQKTILSAEDDEAVNLLSNLKNRVKLDSSLITKLTDEDRWKTEIEKYSSMNKFMTARLLDVNRSTIKERIEFHEKLVSFLKICHEELEKDESSGLKRTRDEENGYCDNKNAVEMNHVSTSSSSESLEEDDNIQVLADCETETLSGVKTRKDVGVLDFCAEKLQELIKNEMREIKEKRKDGIIVQIGIKQRAQQSMYNTRRRDFLGSLVLRLTGNLSVYSLREELAQRLSRSLLEEKPLESTIQSTNPGELSTEEANKIVDEECPKLRTMRKIPLTYNIEGNGYSYSYAKGKTLGMVDIDKNDMASDEKGDKAQVAIPSDENEQLLICDVIGHHDIICLNVEEDDDCKVFDEKEFELIEEPDGDELSGEVDPDITVLDCIEKYCHKEQLEESEMWYCSSCKNHVRAWKQFHLFRAPPILIVHLKRFHFSASTHRRDKITKKIDFPLEGLDLTELVADYSIDNKPIYDCYAVSNHFGGLGGGHYTAYILSDDGTWCNYDDSHVTTNVDPTDVVSASAYVLYYRRRDVPIGQDSDVIVETPPPSPMICEQTDASGEASELSSHSNSAQPGDMDLTSLDDVDSSRSFRTAASPIESTDNSNHNLTSCTDDYVSEFTGSTDQTTENENLPLQ